MESSENLCNSVADVLCKNINLNLIDLSRNFYGLMGGKALTKALYVNNTYNSAVDDGDNVLPKAIRYYHRSNIIMTLELHNSNLDSKGVKVLQEAIINNTTLTSLILRTSEDLCNYTL
ncbi:Protein NLRC3 [Gigaspora margarita]|uniref:Protein NLRC3 n=1 Tax=Gigaspora margarita TaxID=4874 RepID=A0A8H4A517_GIGMA|nr:Protein NLRC3 [Gigaspora margarita]